MRSREHRDHQARAVASRPPRDPRLAGVVAQLWAGRRAGREGDARERLVPSGLAHLALRTEGPAVVVVDGARRLDARLGVLAGPRSTAHTHDAGGAARSVGVVLCADALPRLFGEAAHAFSERHHDLDAVLRAHEADALVDALRARDDEAAQDYLERWLLARLRPSRAPAGLRAALVALDRGATVSEAAARAGCAERTLRAWFDAHVGLAPKPWARVRRVQRAVRLAAREPDWTRVALEAGFCDHAHLCRAVRAVVGVAPSALRAHAPGAPMHLVEGGAGAAASSKRGARR